MKRKKKEERKGIDSRDTNKEVKFQKERKKAAKVAARTYEPKWKRKL